MPKQPYNYFLRKLVEGNWSLNGDFSYKDFRLFPTVTVYEALAILNPISSGMTTNEPPFFLSNTASVL